MKNKVFFEWETEKREGNDIAEEGEAISPSNPKHPFNK